MSTVSKDDIAHLAKLARLAITEEESQRYAEQLSSVVAYVEQLQEVATTESKGVPGVTGLQNVLAADEPRAANDLAVINREQFFAGAPRSKNHLLQVRAVLGSEESA